MARISTHEVRVICCVIVSIDQYPFLQVYTGTAYAIDGCATFFRRDRFSLVKKYEVLARGSMIEKCYGPFPKNTLL